MKFSKASCWVKDRIPPEQEIERLRQEIKNLGSEDEKHFDKVARQAVEVDKLKDLVASLKKNLSRRETSIRDMRTALVGAGDEVSYHGNSYSKNELQEQIRLDARAFLADEETLKSKEEHLKAMQKSLSINKKKLNDLRVVREQMETELQKLQTALAEERQVQAQAQSTVDDADYLRIRKDMDSIRDKIEFLKKKRELKGEASDGPVRATELKREQESKLDKAIEARFGAKKEVVSETGK